MDPLPPECSHWADCDVTHGGCCTLGLHGGKPSLGICNACEHNAKRGQWQPVAETVQVRVPTDEERAKAQASRDVITRGLWRELHWRPAAMIEAGREIDLLAELEWLVAWSHRVPCGDCKQHWYALWDASPADLSSHESYFAWTVAMHNAVNATLSKPLATVEEATKLYLADD